jgi:hypothetical protein
MYEELINYPRNSEILLHNFIVKNYIQGGLRYLKHNAYKTYAKEITMKSSQFHASLKNENFSRKKPRATILSKASRV